MDTTAEETLRTEEWATVAATRSQVYGLLGALYSQLPDEQFVNGLFSPEMAAFLASLSDEEEFPEEVREGAGLVERFVDDFRGRPSDELRTTVGVERTRLFRGVKPGYGPRPPYESVYAEDAGEELDTYPIASVVKAYTEAGVSVPKDSCDQPDYIGFEFDFMRHLCARESAAWERGDRAGALDSIDRERNFLNDHLAQWVPRYCDEMRKDAHLDLYQGIARITRGLVADDSRKVDRYRELACTA